MKCGLLLYTQKVTSLTKFISLSAKYISFRRVTLLRIASCHVYLSCLQNTVDQAPPETQELAQTAAVRLETDVLEQN